MKLTRVVGTALACFTLGVCSCGKAPVRTPEQTMKEFAKVLWEVEGEAKLNEDYYQEGDIFWTGVSFGEYIEIPEDQYELALLLVQALSELLVGYPAYLNCVMFPTVLEMQGEMIGGAMFVSDDEKVEFDAMSFVDDTYGLSVEFDAYPYEKVQ